MDRGILTVKDPSLRKGRHFVPPKVIVKLVIQPVTLVIQPVTLSQAVVLACFFFLNVLLLCSCLSVPFPRVDIMV